MGIELEPKAIGEATEAIASKDFAKAAGIIAGAVVGIAAVSAGLGPFAAVPAALTKKLVECLKETNTEKMLAAARSYDERKEFIASIVQAVAADLSKELNTQGAAIDELASENEAQFYQLIKYLNRNVIEVLEAGQARIEQKTDSILERISEHTSVPFASAADVKVIPPDLNREVELPDHLKNYLHRRLGIAKQRTSGGDEDDRKRANPRDHDSWVESIRQHEVEYEDHPEDQVLHQLVVASSQPTSQKLWMIQGEPGSGKSTLVEHWVERWLAGLDEETRDGMLLPILVRFRDLPAASLPASGSDLAELLWNLAYNGELGTRYPKLYAESRRVMFVPVWFLDGWDEARSDECHTDGFLDHLRKLPGLKVLTCRTAVLSKLRQPTKFDYHVQPNKLYTLRDLDQKEQLGFLNKRLIEYPTKARTLHQTLRQHPQMRAISSSPLLLGLIADMARVEFAKGLDLQLPRSRSAFYQDAIEHAWMGKLQGLGATDEDAILRDDVLKGLAGKMGLENIAIDGRTLIKSMKAIQDLQAREQRERLLGFLVTSGLLRSPKIRMYEFVHLTFQEFYLARRLQQDGFEMALQRYWIDPRYDETLALMLSQLVERGESSIVEDALIRFITWGQEKYDSEPGYFLEKVKRSPLRVTIQLVARSGTHSYALPTLMRHLTERACTSTLVALAISGDSNSPADILTDLAKHEDYHVRENVARHLNTPHNTMRELSKDKLIPVRVQVAANSNTPAEVLRELAKDTNRVRAEVPFNPNTPTETLRELSKDEDPAVRAGLGFNSNTSRDVLAELAKDSNQIGPSQVAQHPNTSEDVLRELAKSEDDSVRCNVARNPNTPEDVLKELAKDERVTVRMGVAEHPNAPEDVLKELAKDERVAWERSVDENSNTPKEVLRELSEKGNTTARKHIASHPNAPEDVLRELAKDEEHEVRRSIAQNPNTPKDVLRELAKDDVSDVRLNVARNLNTPEDVLGELAKDEEHEVRKSIARNPNTPEGVLKELAKDDDYSSFVAGNSNTPAETLRELAKDHGLTVAHNNNLILESV